MLDHTVTLLPPLDFPIELLQSSLEDKGYDLRSRKDGKGTTTLFIFDVCIKELPNGRKLLVDSPESYVACHSNGGLLEFEGNIEDVLMVHRLNLCPLRTSERFQPSMQQEVDEIKLKAKKKCGFYVASEKETWFMLKYIDRLEEELHAYLKENSNKGAK